MVVLIALLLGCGAPCESYCRGVGSRSADWLDSNLNGEEKAELAYYEDGDFSKDGWNSLCEDAPETRDCAECSSWVESTFFTFRFAEEDCIDTYTKDDVSSSTQSRCARQCRSADLIP